MLAFGGKMELPVVVIQLCDNKQFSYANVFPSPGKNAKGGTYLI